MWGKAMPLKKGFSHKSIGANIGELTHAGTPDKQAIVIALDVARREREKRKKHKANGGSCDNRKYANGGVSAGPLDGATPGRSDELAIPVQEGSYVIPADIVAAIGEWNTSRGHDILVQMLGSGQADQADTAIVDIQASDGEFIVPVETVKRLGGGDIAIGQSMLDEFVLETRARAIEALQNIGAPNA